MPSQFNTLCQEITLYNAWSIVKEKGAAGGIDGITSVFECMLTDVQYRKMCTELAKVIVRREDWVNIYPLYTECYARITYIPDIIRKESVKIAVI